MSHPQLVGSVAHLHSFLRVGVNVNDRRTSDGELLHFTTTKNERYTIKYRLKDLDGEFVQTLFIADNWTSGGSRPVCKLLSLG
jgi:hypothetical protein